MNSKTNPGQLQYTVFLSHPSDLSDEDKKLFYGILEKWNQQHDSGNIQFEFKEWYDIPAETDYTSGQAVINKYLKYCDAVIAVFTKKIGTPVDGARSGTIAEIENTVQESKVCSIFINEMHGKERDSEIDDYINNGHGLYTKFENEGQLEHALFSWFDERCRYTGIEPDPEVERFKNAFYHDEPIQTIPERVCNLFFNPFFKPGGATVTWTADTNLPNDEIINYGLRTTAICTIIVSNISDEQLCARTGKRCIRTEGLTHGKVYVHDLLSGHSHAVLTPDRPHVDLLIPEDSYLELIFEPDTGCTLTCNYLGVCNRHIFSFDGNTAPLNP